jgi:hypothetical protein
MIHLLDEIAAAQCLKLQPKTLSRWRWEGKGPIFCRIGGAIRYRPVDLETFIARSRVTIND